MSSLTWHSSLPSGKAEKTGGVYTEYFIINHHSPDRQSPIFVFNINGVVFIDMAMVIQ